MAELAYATDRIAAPTALKSRLMAAVHDASDGPAMAPVSSPDTLEVLRGRRRGGAAPARRSGRSAAGRHSRESLNPTWVRLASAASVVLLAVIAAGVWALTGNRGESTPRFVALKSVTTSNAAVVTVEVLGDKTWVIPTGIAANDVASSQYVLWGISEANKPVAIGGFDIRAGHAAVSVGQVHALSSVKAFAVSKEPGRTVPSKPTVVVASGALT